MNHRWCLIVPIIVTLASTCQLRAEARPDVFRDESLSAAQAEAKSANKFLVADFMATWCGPCKDMDAHTWTNGLVKQWLSENAIAVQVDVDADRADSQALHIDGMPTTIIFNPSNPTEELARHAGHQNPSEILTWFTQVQAQRFLLEHFRSLSANQGALAGILAVGALLVALVVLLLYGKGARKKFDRMMQERAEESWVKPPRKRSPENKLIEGKWTGTCKYKGREAADNSFAATISGDSAISGHIIDSFGEATIVGTIDYPKMRFKKTYSKPAPGTKTASIFAVFFYEGSFTDDGQVNGEWFISPWRKETLCGSWRMKRSQTEPSS